MPQKPKSQADKRRGSHWTDQHGRVWGGTMDRMTGMPVGELQPIGSTAPDGTLRSGWRAVVYHGRELLPPHQYFRFDEEHLGTFAIDYTAWRKELVLAKQAWTEVAQRHAQDLYGDLAGKALAEMPKDLITLVGPPPMPSDLVDAMIEGNKWILGLHQTRPSWAEEYFGPEHATPGERRFEDAPEPGRFADAEEPVEEEMEEGGVAVKTRAKNAKGQFVKQEDTAPPP